MKIYVRFPREEGNKVVDFKDMPKICQPVFFTDRDHIYKVTEITRVCQVDWEAAILVRRSGK